MTVSPVPPGYHNVIPYLIVDGAADAIAWYTKVFGAAEHMRLAMPNGKLDHSEIEIGDTRIMLADEAPEMEARAPAAFGLTRGDPSPPRRYSPARSNRLNGKASGFHPGPHQEALPLGTPPRARPWNHDFLVGARERAYENVETSRSALSLAPTNESRSRDRVPGGRSRRATPSWRVSGRSPDASTVQAIGPLPAARVDR